MTNKATDSRLRLRSHWIALVLIGGFIALQAPTLDYGTRINQLQFIRDYHITSDVVRGSALDRTAVIGSRVEREDTLDRWIMRFKLYPIEVDEIYNVMALSRIKPAQFQFDPHFYLYGGAFLYPLGLYYAVLAKLGVLSIGSLDHMLSDPHAIDNVWIAGRAFVLLGAALSALLFYFALVQFAPPQIALVGLAIYLFSPATIMFSQVLKPHWYALVFANAALLIMARAFVQKRLSRASEVTLGVVLGLAVGSASTFALFAILVWGAMLYLYWRGGMHWRTLFLVPAVAVAVWLVTNPYYVLDRQALMDEVAAHPEAFAPRLSLEVLLSYLHNSILPGFGVVLTLVFLAVVLRDLVRPASTGVRLLALGIIIPIIAMAALMAPEQDVYANFRYVAYVLPLIVVFLAVQPLRYRKLMLAIAAAGAVVQAIPLKLAYLDENSDTNSTRLAAASWIDSHVPRDDTICISNETAPYTVPPFRFDRYKINTPDCKWRVQAEGLIQSELASDRWSIARQFRPRLSPAIFPLVWGNINPKITIYRKRDS